MEKIPKSWDSGDYEEKMIRAGELTEPLVMEFGSITKEVSEEYGAYYIAHGLKDKRPVGLYFNSVKLANLLMEQQHLIENKTIKIVPRGKDIERKYIVSLVTE